MSVHDIENLKGIAARLHGDTRQQLVDAIEEINAQFIHMAQDVSIPAEDLWRANITRQAQIDLLLSLTTTKDSE